MFEDEMYYWWYLDNDDSDYIEWLDMCAEEEEDCYFNDWCAVTD